MEVVADQVIHERSLFDGFEERISVAVPSLDKYFAAFETVLGDLDGHKITLIVIV